MSIQQQPTWAEVIADPYEHAVVVDWKEDPDEVVWNLQERYPTAGFDDDAFDELVDNYQTEPGPLAHAALGQELRRHDHALFHLESDTDEYHFVVVPDGEREAFLAAVAEAGAVAHLQAQTGRRPDEPAERLTPPEPSDHPATWFRPGAELRACGDRMIMQWWASGHHSFWLDTGTWPPEQTPIVTPYDATRFAARDRGGLIGIGRENDERLTELHVLSGDMTGEWEPLLLPEGVERQVPPNLSIGERSLLAFGSARFSRGEGGCLWAIDDVVGGDRQLRAVRGAPEHMERMWVLHDHDRVWVLIDNRLFRYHAGEVHDTGVCWRIDGAAAIDGRAFFLYGATVGLLDLDTGRFQDVGHAQLGERIDCSVLTEGWLLLFRAAPPSRAYDVAHLWHPETGQRLRIPFGHLGDLSISDCVITPQGHIWFADSGGENLLDAGPFGTFRDGLPSLDVPLGPTSYEFREVAGALQVEPVE